MRTRPPIPKPEKQTEKPESNPLENPPSLEPVKAGTEPVPKPLIAANEQIGQDLVNDRPKLRPGRPSKASAQVVIADPVEKKPIKYPDRTPGTDAMAEIVVKNLTGGLSMLLGEHCLYDPKRDEGLVDAWSKYFAYKGYTNFPPSYALFGSMAAFLVGVAMDPRTQKRIRDLKNRKNEKIVAAQEEIARNN